MRQEINLYSDGFEIPKVHLPANQIAVVAGLSLVIFALISGLNASRSASLNSSLFALAGEKERKAAETAELLAKLESRVTDAGLQRKIDGLQRSVRAKQRLIALLGEGGGGNVSGFSAFLRGLSSHPISGVWLTQIQLTEGGEDILLSGVTTRPENIPGFLQSIGQEQPFKSRKFEKLELKKAKGATDAEAGERLTFLVRTRLEGSKR